jgi:hypothetical protein
MRWLSPGWSAVEAAKGALSDAKQATARAAPSRGGFLGLFDKATQPTAGDAKAVVGDAADTAKGALPNAGKHFLEEDMMVNGKRTLFPLGGSCSVSFLD